MPVFTINYLTRILREGADKSEPIDWNGHVHRCLTFQLIESKYDNVFEAQREPAFHELNEIRRPLLPPIVSDGNDVTDFQAREFYHCNRPTA